MKWLLIILIRVYQVTISKLLMPSCRFYPSCSQYALVAVTEHGAVKGAGLAGWRLLRCNPWNSGGLDPVPSRGHWRPDILSDGSPRSGPQYPDAAAG
ncbi:MAG: membrane protein insertion efficiency factor YidD [Actinobacteria bacterium]|nr:membrane protein insertion efficiency factor YidD [Actinomycetota bacterium]